MVKQGCASSMFNEISNVQKIKGFNLTELVITLLIVSLGIAGLLAVISSVNKKVFYPEIEWQSVKIGEAVIDGLMAKSLKQFPCAQSLESNDDLCAFQFVDQEPFSFFFDNTPKDAFNHFRISVYLTPLQQNHDIALITVKVHSRIGMITLNSTKAVQ